MMTFLLLWLHTIQLLRAAFEACVYALQSTFGIVSIARSAIISRRHTVAAAAHREAMQDAPPA